MAVNKCLTTKDLFPNSGSHEQVTIGSKHYGLITIGTHRYLIDYLGQGTNLAWYDNDADMLNLVTKGTSVNSLPMNNLCIPCLTDNQVKAASWEDAYRTTITLSEVIRSHSTIPPSNRSRYAGYYVGTSESLDIRWSLPTYELAYYLSYHYWRQLMGYEDRDWLSTNTGWDSISSDDRSSYFWLPFSKSSIHSWSIKTDVDGVSLGYTSVRTAYKGYISLPCALI